MKKLLSLLLIGLLVLAGCTTQSPDPQEPDTPPETVPGETNEPDSSQPGEPTEQADGYKVYPANLTKAHSLEEAIQLMSNEPLPADIVQAIRDFGLSTGPQLLDGTKNDNYSPLSLYIALAMVATGAEGQSAEELYAALNRPLDREALADEISDIMARLNIETSHGRIQLANSIWNQFDFPFKSDYIDRLNDRFQASLFEVDFTDPATGQKMTDWVSDATEGLIEPTFDDTEDYISVLFNALYFKESWHKPFQSELTKPGPFKGVDGETEKDFLHSNSMLQYIKHDGVEGVVLPFEVSRMILLKKSGSNPMDILKDYTLDELLSKAQSAQVDLKLPKFSFDNEYQLPALLNQLGIKQVMDPDQADLSGMTDQDLYVSSVIQQSFIGLDETGVEAAAVTSVIMETTGIPSLEAELVFDEPFLFIIESPDGLPLFIGTLTN